MMLVLLASKASCRVHLDDDDDDDDDCDCDDDYGGNSADCDEIAMECYRGTISSI